MKLNEFKDRLRTSLSPAEPSARISRLIDQKLLAVQHRRTSRRRIAFAFAATAVVGLSILVLPRVRAQAELARLAGALDNVQSVIETQQNVAADGSRHYLGQVAYLNGRWRIDLPGSGITYFSDGTRYMFDQRMKRFMVESGLEGPFGHNSKDMKLSSVLGDIKHWQPHSHLEIDQAKLHGKVVTRATIEDLSFKSRVVLFAELDTDLPLETHEERLDAGKWRLTSVATFDYGAKQSLAEFVPDLKAFPAISKKEWSAELVRGMIKDDLGSVKLANGRLVVRSIDVAKDGTVFVACQAGERIPMWDRGYPVDITDDSGSKYALMHVSSRLDSEFISASKDGKLELCIFVPVNPNSSWEPKKIAVNTRLDATNHLDRHLEAMWGGIDNFIDGYSWYYDTSKAVSVTEVARQSVEKPITDSFPSFAALIDPNQFDDAQHFAAQEAKSRADYFRNHGEYKSERYWLNESIRLEKPSNSRSDADRRLIRLNEFEARVARRHRQAR